VNAVTEISRATNEGVSTEETLMRTNRNVVPRFAAIAGAVAALGFVPGEAAGADYFAGKTIKLVVGTGPVGGYALYGQLLAQHFARFIPGKPAVVASYMPGAAGLNAMNWLYEVAPRDGTAIAVAMQELPYQQALGVQGVRYDASRFNYIGRAAANVPVHMIWHTAAVKSFGDLRTREVITGAGGSSGTQVDLPRAQNALLGTKWKIITGYREASDRYIAVDRGEIQATIAPATLFNDQFKPWREKGLVNVVVQYADFRHPLFPDVPAIVEFAEGREAKGVLNFLVSASTVGRGYVAPPGVPIEAVRILRDGFDAMVSDATFKADAEKRGADLLPMKGEALAAYIRDIVATPSDIIKKTNDVIAAK
jgi:tripartite-type tricarboxylate transporter receptor subunit TctC